MNSILNFTKKVNTGNEKKIPNGVKLKTKFFVLILLSALLQNSCKESTTTVIGTNTFGSLLNGFFNRANQLIQQMQNSGLILEVNGAAQVQNLIASARDAYKDDLNTTVNALSAQQQQLLSSIDGALNKIQAGVTDITSDITQIALILPMSNKFPQLTSYKGTIVSPQLDSQIVVQLKGVFHDLPKNGYEATLNLGNKSFKGTNTTQEIKFKIPASEFKSKKTKIDYNPFEIDINYSKRRLLVFSSKETAKFHLYFIILPTSFGSYVLETLETVDTTLFEDKICPNLSWNTHSGNDDGTIKGCPMEEGWICDVNSVHPINFRNEEGRMNVDWFDRGSASAPTFAGWNFLATTRHGPFGNYGGLTIDLAYKRFKKTQVLRTKVFPEIPLQWGDEKVVSINPTAQWKLIFKQFDGKKKEIASSEQLSPYLKVNSLGSRIEIKLAPWGF